MSPVGVKVLFTIRDSSFFEQWRVFDGLRSDKNIEGT
jgi:hypothetical protein